MIARDRSAALEEISPKPSKAAFAFHAIVMDCF